MPCKDNLFSFRRVPAGFCPQTIECESRHYTRAALRFCSRNRDPESLIPRIELRLAAPELRTATDRAAHRMSLDSPSARFRGIFLMPIERSSHPIYSSGLSWELPFCPTLPFL